MRRTDPLHRLSGPQPDPSLTGLPILPRSLLPIFKQPFVLPGEEHQPIAAEALTDRAYCQSLALWATTLLRQEARRRMQKRIQNGPIPPLPILLPSDSQVHQRLNSWPQSVRTLLREVGAAADKQVLESLTVRQLGQVEGCGGQTIIQTLLLLESSVTPSRRPGVHDSGPLLELARTLLAVLSQRNDLGGVHFTDVRLGPHWVNAGEPCSTAAEIIRQLQDPGCRPASLVSAHPFLEALDRMVRMTAADEIRDISIAIAKLQSASPNQHRNAEVVAERFGVLGDEVSDWASFVQRHQLNRNHLGRIITKMRELGSQVSIYAPATARVVSRLNELMPISHGDAEQQLREVLGERQSLKRLLAFACTFLTVEGSHPVMTATSQRAGLKTGERNARPGLDWM